MRLAKVTIKNFKSVEDVTLDLNISCRVLVGINESGKSNILQALALLDPERAPNKEDIRFLRSDETDVDQPAWVRFVFNLEKNERIELFELLRPNIAFEVEDREFATIKGKRLSVAQFCDTRTEVLYIANLRSQTKYFLFWQLSEDTTFDDDIVCPTKTCPDSAIVKLLNDEPRRLNTLDLIDRGLVPSEFAAYVEPVTRDWLGARLVLRMKEVLGSRLPSCLFWEFRDEYLLPGLVDLASFRKDPKSCLPLKSMFELAGYSEIAEALDREEKRPNGVLNLLGRVGRIATEHMRTVWKDYKGIEVVLRPNGNKIEAVIKDAHNLYDMARRSDGFKRFVSFLFLVSAKVKTKELTNTLYLQDEPDSGLHPSGATHLRKELIRIAQSNCVVFSTHSIFMVDREVIRRHYIVRKENESTRIDEVGESNIVDEEVVYNALGHSVFHELKEMNIVFEGWQDKALFRTAMSKVPAKHSALKGAVGGCGQCHARGVKDVTRVTAFLELLNRKCVILSDGDGPAREKQREFGGDAPWVRYDELVEGSEVVTAEDFIRGEVLSKETVVMAETQTGIAPMSVADFEGKHARLKAIQAWLHAAGVGVDEVKSMLAAMKVRIFSDLKPAQIEPKYYEHLEGLAKVIAAS